MRKESAYLVLVIAIVVYITTLVFYGIDNEALNSRIDKLELQARAQTTIDTQSIVSNSHSEAISNLRTQQEKFEAEIAKRFRWFVGRNLDLERRFVEVEAVHKAKNAESN